MTSLVWQDAISADLFQDVGLAVLHRLCNRCKLAHDQPSVLNSGSLLLLCRRSSLTLGPALRSSLCLRTARRSRATSISPTLRRTALNFGAAVSSGASHLACALERPTPPHAAPCYLGQELEEIKLVRAGRVPGAAVAPTTVVIVQQPAVQQQMGYPPAQAYPAQPGYPPQQTY